MHTYQPHASITNQSRRFNKRAVKIALVTAVVASSAAITEANAANCESLRSLRLPNTVIDGAQTIPAGSYQPPGSQATFADLPSFCRVTGTVSPVPGSSIRIEVWLPTKTWNGRYQQSGNHGFTGVLYWSEMVRQLRRGYATGVTDDGHTAGPGFDVSWAFGYPQRIVDLAYRAVHELAVKSKLVINAYYGKSARYAYFNGCSDGGREGMKEAQMFPEDFDGIIAGGAAQYWTHAATEQLVMSINLKNAGIQGTHGAAILTLAQNAATAACDAKDGVVDGLIGNPQKCKWDPATLVCKAGQDPGSCITPAQALALKENIEPVRDPQTGRYIFSGMTRGSEFDQIRFGYNQGLAPFGIGNYRIALNAPTWDGSMLDLHTNLPILDRVLGSVNAIDPDLTAFKRAGGKLIQWHGWDDAASTPGWTVKYYNEVVDETGNGRLAKVQDFYRLFMLPGVGHCGSGPGPDNIGAENQTAYSQDPRHDIVSALEAWVERGKAPDFLIATKYVNNDSMQGVQMQRPICVYPAEAVYDGRGDTNDAKNFSCSDPSARRNDGSSTVAPISD